MAQTTTVQVWVDDKEVGAVKIIHDSECEPTQIAASAHAALSNDAKYIVNGETITVEDIKEWWA